MNKRILDRDGITNFLLNNIWDTSMETLSDEVITFVDYADEQYFGYMVVNCDTKEISDLVYRIYDILEEELETTYGKRITLNLSYTPTVPFYILYILFINMFDHYKNNNQLSTELANRLTEKEILAIIGDAFDYAGISMEIYNAYMKVADIEIDIDTIPQYIDVVILNMLDEIREYIIKAYIQLLGVIKTYITIYPNISISYIYTQLQKPHFVFRDRMSPKTVPLNIVFNNGAKAGMFPKNHRLDMYSLDIILTGGIQNEKR